MRHHALLLLAVFACLSASAATVPGADARSSFTPPPGAHVVTVVTHEYRFDMPASIPAGLTTFVLHDAGKQDHHLMIVRLADGKTLGDFMAALSHPEAGLPGWAHMVGGPNTPFPGERANATLVLQAGHYVAFCIIPAPDAKPHIMHGMVQPFTVTPSRTAPAPLPKADLHIALTDYGFKLARPITAGRHLIEVTNHSSQPHEMVITRFPPGQGNRDLEAWGHDPHGMPAPGHAMGGVTDMAPGSVIVISVDFTPGHYGLLCFVPDRQDHRPHFMHGMQKEFDVR